MKNQLKKLSAAAMSITMAAGSMFGTAFAATEAEAIIDTSRKTSLTIYKYDSTEAAKNGWTDETYVSDGHENAEAEAALADYAIEGVEFTYFKVADITIYKGKNMTTGEQEVVPLYSFKQTQNPKGTNVDNLIKVLGLTTSDAYSYDPATPPDTEAGKDILYFESDQLIDTLRERLDDNSTSLKNELEAYIAGENATRMPLTDANGKTSAENLDQGLYLVVETKVPEGVTSTVEPFFVSLPMTDIDGDEWNYDVTVYPKNETGSPDMEKTVRESKDDTGKNNGSTTDINDGFAHTATGSDGDVVDYQIISTLPAITSDATGLSTYTFVDRLSKGITYNKKDVQIEFFTDAACTNKVATWTEADGKFAVNYKAGEDLANPHDTVPNSGFEEHKTTTDKNYADLDQRWEQQADPDMYASVDGEQMTISMTAAGLKEINTSEAVYDTATALERGYSRLTMRITYSAKIDSDNSVVYGDAGNPNTVDLEWRRTSSEYFDHLVDDCHVYTYGIDLTKQFSDDQGDYENVEFLVHNTSDTGDGDDGYYVVAELNEAEGVYYVTGHTASEAEATHFSPMKRGAVNEGKIILRGVEDDTYVMTEVVTDDGYTLLKENITVAISTAESDRCEVCGKNVLTASATVNGNAAAMNAENGSENAVVPLTVVNTKGFELPVTGGNGTWMFAAAGVAAIAAAGAVIIINTRKNKAA